jgi:hypothetical protein
MKRLQVLELVESYSLVGRRCFNEVNEYIQRLKLDLLDVTPCFEIPLSENSLSYLLGLKQFKNFSRPEMKKVTTNYPLKAMVFTEIQKEIAKRFRLTLTGNWISKVHDKVEEVLLKEFKINKKTAHRIKKESELNPFIIRFFR